MDCGVLMAGKGRAGCVLQTLKGNRPCWPVMTNSSLSRIGKQIVFISHTQHFPRVNGITLVSVKTVHTNHPQGVSHHNDSLWFPSKQISNQILLFQSREAMVLCNSSKMSHPPPPSSHNLTCQIINELQSVGLQGRQTISDYILQHNAINYLLSRQWIN